MTNTNEARIETSTICNYSCSFCPLNTKSFKRKKEVMSFKLFKEIINKLPENIEVVTLSGMGEPFLDDTIFDKIKYCKEKGYIVNSLTNGSLFDTEKMIKMIDSGLDSLRVSFHYYDINKYKKLTGASSKNYENVVELINVFHYTKNNIKIIMTVDVLEEDKKDIENIIRNFKDKVDLLEIWKVHNWVNWKEYRKGEKVKQTCGRPFNGPLQIQVDGTINMCCFDFNGELLLGDFKNQKIDEIFNSKMYNKIKNFHLGRKENNLICEKCDQLYKKNNSIVIYNSRFEAEERIGKISTTYRKME